MMKFPKDHPYMIRLDEVLKQYFVCKVTDANGAKHGEEYEEMKEEILNALFVPPEEIRPNTPKTIMGSADFDELPRYDFSEQKYTDD